MCITLVQSSIAGLFLGLIIIYIDGKDNGLRFQIIIREHLS